MHFFYLEVKQKSFQRQKVTVRVSWQTFYFISKATVLFKEAILSPKITHKLYLPNCVRDVAEFRKPPWEEAVIFVVW
jgi:hypothetical protein